MAKTVRLKNCPFCYHGNGHVNFSEKDLFGEIKAHPYTVFCNHCGVGCSGKTEADAIQAWQENDGIPKY